MALRCGSLCRLAGLAAPLLALGMLLGMGTGADGATVYERKTPVPPSFFGLIIHRAHTTTPWPAVNFGSWMLWDSYVKWSDIEPANDEWHFDAFDRQVQLGTEHRVELAYTLGQTPAWASTRPDERFAWGLGAGAMPRDLADFRRYVSKVVERYKGRIAAYQVWNEPKLGEPGRCQGTVFFCGSADDLARLTEVAREVISQQDPQARLLTPAFTGGKAGVEMLDRYLDTGAGRLVDGIGFHFYDREPEESLATVALLRTVLAKHGLSNLPIWDTEVGFLIHNDERTVAAGFSAGAFSRVLTAREAGALLTRAMLLQAAAGLDRVYWYAWDDPRMGLTHTTDGHPNEAGKAYGVVRQWLLGSTIRCQEEPRNQWECQLARAGRSARVLWRTDGKAPPPCPSSALLQRVEDELGEPSLSVTSQVPAVGGPILCALDGTVWSGN